MDKDNVVLAAIAALGVPVSAVLVRIVDAWTKGSERRSDERARQATEYEKRRDGEIAEAYRRLAEERETNRALRDENRALEADRDEGWDVGRGWERMAHEINHKLNNAIQLLPERGRPEPMNLPRFRDIRRVEAPKP